MTPRPVAIIGAGYAGLACAVELARRQVPVSVFERSHSLGGRARGVFKDGWQVDNGQHILLGAYAELTRLMRLVGVTPRALRTLPLTLEIPEVLSLRAAGLPAPWHLAWGLLRAKGLTWRDRKAAMAFLDRLKKCRFRLERDTTVAHLLIQHSQTPFLRQRIWEPLCVAALNTPAEDASAQVFVNVLRDSLAADARASDMLLPRVDLSELFPVPATRYLGSRRGVVNTATPITALDASDEGFLLKGDASEQRYQQVVLATAPYHATALLASTGRCERLVALIDGLDYEPIVTIYLAYPADVGLTGPLVGLPDGPGQWGFDRARITGLPADHNLLSVVISARGPHEEWDRETLIVAIHAQLERLLHRRLPAPEWSQVITEKRATFACRPGLQRPTHRTPVPGLWLAGDYVDSEYPATLESAVRSGITCAQAVLTRLGQAGALSTG